ncbi:unnamed protein product [Lactuca saligna]|uniref:Uncharacterized protein n=1 Tax=Lactuca saligna TaxID=75948 RepID=A0AA35ZTY1_LACSI|nr:unnamed protein product [Lactuca saligna]
MLFLRLGFLQIIEDVERICKFRFICPTSDGRLRLKSFENKTRVSFSDKQTGSYGRATATEKASTGDFQWQNGKSGTRSEYKESSTVRVGDKSGYTEVYNEQRVRNVRVRNVSFNNNGSKSVITYDNGDGGYGYRYGGGYDSD